MKLSDKFITYDTDEGEAMIVSTDTEVFSGIVKGNKAAAVMLDLLKKDITRDELVAALCEKYDAPKEQLEGDVDKFIETLKKINALED